jgi:hypothetical protein
MEGTSQMRVRYSTNAGVTWTLLAGGYTSTYLTNGTIAGDATRPGGVTNNGVAVDITSDNEMKRLHYDLVEAPSGWPYWWWEDVDLEVVHPDLDLSSFISFASLEADNGIFAYASWQFYFPDPNYPAVAILVSINSGESWSVIQTPLNYYADWYEITDIDCNYIWPHQDSNWIQNFERSTWAEDFIPQQNKIPWSP